MGDTPDYAQVKPVAQFIIEKFLAGECDRVVVLYTDFINTLLQKPMVNELLPIASFQMGGKPVEKEEAVEEDSMSSFKYEPSAEAVLNALIPFYIGNHDSDGACFRAKRPHGGDEERHR